MIKKHSLFVLELFFDLYCLVENRLCQKCWSKDHLQLNQNHQDINEKKIVFHILYQTPIFAISFSFWGKFQYEPRQNSSFLYQSLIDTMYEQKVKELNPTILKNGTRQQHHIHQNQYELFIEYDKCTLLIQLNTQGKYFRRLICNTGEYKLTYKKEPIKVQHLCQNIKELLVKNLFKGVLSFQGKKIQLKQVTMLNLTEDPRKKKLRMLAEEPHSFIEKTFHKFFSIEDNRITLMAKNQFITKGDDFENVLLDMVVGEHDICSFRAKIHKTQDRRICVGVMDRRTSDNVKYSGYMGIIMYPLERVHQTYDCLSQGMEIRVEINRFKGQIHFTLTGESINSVTNEPIRGMRNYFVQSNILKEQNRELVPFFQMGDVEDSISWSFD